jgi:antitoxin component YwqK of YwqJK toxin-antitoxin module/Tfp pilus assembly protein PilF
MKLKILVLTTTLFILGLKVESQKMSCDDLNPNSGKLIRAGVDAYDKDNYQEAVNYYLKIFPGDTNYYYAQYELGISYESLKKHEEVVIIARELLDRNEGNMVQNTNMLGNALDGLGKTEEALQVYDDALAKWPNEYLLHFNKGITLFLAKKYAEAEQSFIRSAELNPVHQGSHYFLGILNIMGERYIQGMMALEYSMLLGSNNGKYSSAGGILDEASVLQSPKKEERITLSLDVNEAGDFAGANEIYKSLLALNAKYKPKKLPGLRVLKQTQLFFDNIESIGTNNNSFYTRYYLKFFRKMKDKRLTRTFMAQVFGGLENDELAKLFNSEKKNLSKMVDAFKEFASETASKVNIRHNGKDYFSSVEYNDKGSISIAYELNPDGLEINKNGLVLVFFEDGGIYKETRLTNGKLTGECKIYNANGTLSEVNNLVEGVIQGVATEYYGTGEILVKKTYKDDLLEGEVTVLYPDGKLKRVYSMTKGVKNGLEKQYYNNGKPSAEYMFKDGEYSGSMKEYYNNGKIQYEYQYKDGKIDGLLKGYYTNGNPTSEKTFKSGTLVGSYKDFFPNGKVKEEGNYDDKGNRTGTWKTYFYNGTLSNEATYLNGEKQGKGVEYARDGVKHYEYEYAGGNYTMIKFFDKTGNVIQEFKEEKNILKYTFYTPEGIKTFDGALKDGKSDGMWTTYFPTTGTVFKTVNYLKGDATGEWKEYYADGVVHGIYQYEKNEQEGTAYTFFEDGVTLSSQYCSKKGDAAGRIINYFPNGSKRDESYYLFGSANGPIKRYDLLGRVYEIDNYKDGYYTGEILYDSLGGVLFELKTTAGLVPYERNYPNGKVKVKGSYLNGELHDSLILYFPDGKVSSTGYYENGNPEGKVTVYNHLGNITEERNYSNGKLNGPRTYYYANGKVSEIFQYMDGEEYGTALYYYPNGNKEYEVERENGFSQGWGIWYDENGKESHKTYYVNDDAVFYTYKDKSDKWVDKVTIQNNDGKMQSFYSSGKKFIDRTYKGGLADGLYMIYFADGTPYCNFNYTNGTYNGSVKEYYTNKKIRKDESYWYGELHGLQKYYNENGTLLMELTYEFGNLNGTCKYYDKNGKIMYTCIYYQDVAVDVR